MRVLQPQLRLSEAQVLELVSRYLAGESVVQLGRAYSIHRTTVLEHLERRGVPRRQVTAKLSGEQVAVAAKRYRGGSSVRELAAEFGVAERNDATDTGAVRRRHAA